MLELFFCQFSLSVEQILPVIVRRQPTNKESVYLRNAKEKKYNEKLPRMLRNLSLVSELSKLGQIERKCRAIKKRLKSLSNTARIVLPFSLLAGGVRHEI